MNEINYPLCHKTIHGLISQKREHSGLRSHNALTRTPTQIPNWKSDSPTQTFHGIPHSLQKSGGGCLHQATGCHPSKTCPINDPSIILSLGFTYSYN
jgi:hypothetical protein